MVQKTVTALCDGCEQSLPIQVPEPDIGVRLVCEGCAQSQNDPLFANARFVTIGCSRALSDDEIYQVWELLEARKRLYGKSLSYLQVFYLKRLTGTLKVWVIDNGAATVMLLPEEY